MFLETQKIPHITPHQLESLQYGVNIRQQLLHQIITTFETRFEDKVFFQKILSSKIVHYQS